MKVIRIIAILSVFCGTVFIAVKSGKSIDNLITAKETIIQTTFETETTTENQTETTTETTSETTTEQKRYEIENWEAISGNISVKVNLSTNTVTAYKGDTPIKAMICSSGYYTPTGSFRVSDKYRWHYLLGNVSGQYCTRIYGKILIHSIPYYSQNIHSLCTEEYNKLGTTCSHGCIRMQAADAKWIFDNCPSGTSVVLYEDNKNPGPLGKPEISQIPVNQTWDPTDPEIVNAISQ
ncbi:MAG: L,D-transpeptidase [Firmicutes bacterium]|nr:L,D-transpeptidase [Bacillota bacterium]